MKISLNNEWKMKKHSGAEWLPAGNLPVSMYQTLLKNRLIENPYFKENEYISTELSAEDYDFSCTFRCGAELSKYQRKLIRFNGVDMLSQIYLNGELLGTTDNMHRVYEFDATDRLFEGENTLTVELKSPLDFVREKQQKRPLWGVDTTTGGYPYLRKAHYMFGWDWGPVLPDMGIWRGAELICCNDARLDGVYVRQSFDKSFTRLSLSVDVDIEMLSDALVYAEVEVKTADGRELTAKLSRDEKTAEFSIENPLLWYPRGYGAQPLNTLNVRLFSDKGQIDEHIEKIGFREIRVSHGELHANDVGESGEEFCFVVNGIKIFAMGADYIPQDQILPLITEESTEDTINRFCDANYNCIRVWGGGYYPDDCFFRFCAEKGILVWEDFMFACSAYLLSDGFRETVEAELCDNIKRLRNHASLALWCGNNEIESAWEGWGIPQDEEAKRDYVTLFEEIIPAALKRLDPNTFYWPSSPSSGGNQYDGDGCFNNSSITQKGDSHY